MRYLRIVIDAANIVLLAVFIISFFSSCKTQEETLREHYRMTRIVDRMDSLINNRQVITQDSTWRELVVRQLNTIMEKNDTSRTVVVDTTGRVIKETLIIRNEKSVNSETEQREREVMLHRLEVLDSTLSCLRQQISESDSVLKEKITTSVREVEKPLSWWQKIFIWLGGITVISLITAAVVLGARKGWLKKILSIL